MQTQEQAFAPLSGSNNTMAQYKNPFGFSLQVIQSTVNLDLSYGHSCRSGDVCSLSMITGD